MPRSRTRSSPRSKQVPHLGFARGRASSTAFLSTRVVERRHQLPVVQEFLFLLLARSVRLKPNNRGARHTCVKLEASAAAWRSKALSLQRRNAELKKSQTPSMLACRSGSRRSAGETPADDVVTGRATLSCAVFAGSTPPRSLARLGIAPFDRSPSTQLCEVLAQGRALSWMASRSQQPRHSEHVLAVRDRLKNILLDPLAVQQHALLVAARTKVAGLAGVR
jgi:hypothetical protein